MAMVAITRLFFSNRSQAVRFLPICAYPIP